MPPKQLTFASMYLWHELGVQTTIVNGVMVFDYNGKPCHVMWNQHLYASWGDHRFVANSGNALAQLLKEKTHDLISTDSTDDGVHSEHLWCDAC